MKLSIKHIYKIGHFPFTKKGLWYTLFGVCLMYNFHRYIFKYSHGLYGREGYQQTPLVWQSGKFVIIAVIMAIIYSKSRFILRIGFDLLALYFFLLIVLLTNVCSLILYGQILTDEIEYTIYGFILFPLALIQRQDLLDLGCEMNTLLNIGQYIIIGSNLIVIINYLLFRVIPFHAYEGILMRFGGLWDDPNTLAIISVFFLGYALFNKQYFLAVLHTIDVLMAISFTGYLLLFVLISYFFLNNDRNRLLHIIIFIGIIILLCGVFIVSYEYIIPIYEAKEGSIAEHANIDFTFMWLPLLQAVQFHETWWLSIVINYFPFSVPFIIAFAWSFVQFFLFEPKSQQRLLFIIFCITSLFLPFLYMFPINFISLMFLVMYMREVRF